MPDSANFPLGVQVTIEELVGDVHPILHRLRTAEPVSWLPALNAWLVTRHDLAVAVMRDAKTYTVDHPGFSTAQVVGPSMLSLDGEEHGRQRRPFDAPFRRAAVHNRFRQPVAQHITQLLAELAPKGEAELRRQFAGPVAVKTMMTALGLEGVVETAVLGWYDTIVQAVTQVTAGEPVSVEGRAAFAALRDTLLPSLQREPEANLLAAASGAAHGLSNEAIVSNAAVLLFGGIETTEGMIANALYFLLTNRAWLQRVQEEPALLPKVIEETLRLEPAAGVVDRYATRDVRLGEANIAAGDLVRVSLSGANRDPAIFPQPDQFDPLRPNLREHVAFAQGPHVCLGLHLARLEAQLALQQILTRLPGLQLRETEAAASAAKPQGLVFRKPEVLWVHW
jgi:cytochrome P450